MLINMHVKNLALIEEADIDFYEGLNILTGETGAGKSIILGSMNLALGEKIQKEMLRENAEYALVELVFQVDDAEITEQLQKLDIFPEEGCVILSRKIMNGRSIAKINGETVTASKMKEAASYLIDIHGQHEHESLLHRKKHLEILDDFAKNELDPVKLSLRKQFMEYKAAQERLESMNTDEEERIRQLSFLEFEIDEIEKANFSEGEDVELEAQYKKMSNGRRIIDSLAKAYELTESSQTAAAEEIGMAIRQLNSVSIYDEAILDFEEQLTQIENLLNDCNREMHSYIEEMDFSEELFAEVENRLNELNRLKAKYGADYEQVMQSYEQRVDEANRLHNFEEEKIKAEQEYDAAKERLQNLCDQASMIRKKYADKLIVQLTDSLKELNFMEVQFDICFEQTPSFTAIGTDEIEFMISTNTGEPLKPLAKVASGGELSRVMLAIKTVLAHNDKIDTLIFDEIDSGISGRTAQKVSEKLDTISRNHQIICITHLPQIASMADAHFLIEKSVQHNATVSMITPLSQEESVSELARMLGGVEITDAVMQNAREMKKLAYDIKRKQ